MMQFRTQSVRVRRRAGVAAALLAVVAGSACSPRVSSSTTTTTTLVPGQPIPNPGQRTLDAYRGLGAWVDVFDYVPAFQTGGATPRVSAANVEDMARLGVKTLYLQVSRDDERSPTPIVDEQLVSEFVRRAHAHGVRVVAWYAPRLLDANADLARVVAMDKFRVDGHGFDGIALDIEATDVADIPTRNDALIALSISARREVRGTLGAIVLPTVQIESLSSTFWPSFPWGAIAKSYDVWLPMAYATFRKEPYRDHVRYIDESVQRMRANLGNPKAEVHVIGGIADKMTPEDFAAVRQAGLDTKALGWSAYDYATTPSTAWPELRDSEKR
ncbi:MAG: hypothetical protein ACOYN3_09725 [Acidimicrobiia bacterium]